MEAIGIQTNKSKVASVDAELQKMFPLQSNGIFYISFMGDSETQLKRLYAMQNQWLKDVKSNAIGEFKNIDEKYLVGDNQEMSL